MDQWDLFNYTNWYIQGCTRNRTGMRDSWWNPRELSLGRYTFGMTKAMASDLIVNVMNPIDMFVKSIC